ncbi:hypothetical protein JOM56_004359 [Amanita muscaria]
MSHSIQSAARALLGSRGDPQLANDLRLSDTSTDDDSMARCRIQMRGQQPLTKTTLLRVSSSNTIGKPRLFNVIRPEEIVSTLTTTQPLTTIGLHPRRSPFYTLVLVAGLWQMCVAPIAADNLGNSPYLCMCVLLFLVAFISCFFGVVF